MSIYEIHHEMPEEHVYQFARPEVLFPEDLQIWKKSQSYLDYKQFTVTMNDAVRGKVMALGCPLSDSVSAIVTLLDKLDLWIDESPPSENVQWSGTGNSAFKHMYMQIRQGSLEILRQFFPVKYRNALPEVVAYFNESFGTYKKTRYGVGHEMSFMLFLFSLFKIGAFSESDQVPVVSNVFGRYLEIVRKLQLKFRMEPSGSQGVWGLDDYQFIPYIWGSSQLINHPRIDPSDILQADVVNLFAKSYLFLGCIQHISKTKSGHFAEHSNQLWNLSAIPLWSKINQGLIKMYKNQVLDNFSVIKHMLFGTLLTLHPATPIPIVPTFHNQTQQSSFQLKNQQAPSESGVSLAD